MKANLTISIFIVSSAMALAGDAEQAEFFEAKVRPLLIEKCQNCHGATKQQASLRLDTKKGLQNGGESGSAIVAGQVDESLLIQAVRREGLEMPPEEPLDASEIAIFEKWIRDGGFWPKEADQTNKVGLGDQVAIHQHAAEHWAFQPITKPLVPRVLSDADVRNPIDAFLVSKLEQAGIKPVEMADRRTLLRRATYDVVGLPPTVKAVEDFLNSEAANAFPNAVHDLLSSKQFGQRWGRYWLDIARYADTRDWQAQTDERFPFAYTYRDYVIRSINDDKPYDLFLKEQLAADLMTSDPHEPSLAALGFMTVGPRFRNNELEQIADRLDAVTRGLMGITVACARCHDHKYDPIKIDDYYSLYGVFDSTSLTDELPTLKTSRRISPEESAAYEKAKAEKVQSLDDYIVQLRSDAIEEVAKDPMKYFKAFHETSLTRSMQIRGAITKFKVQDTAMTAFEASMEQIIKNKSLANDRVLGPLVVGLSLSEKEFRAKASEFITEQSDAKRQRNPVVVKALVESQPKSRLELLETYANVFAHVTVDKEHATPDNAAVRHAFFESSGVLDFTRQAVIAGHRLLGGGRKKLGDFESDIREVDATHPGSPPRAMIVTEKSKPVNSYVMLRGEPSRRGDVVPRRFIAFLENGDPKPFEQGSGRLELAERVTSPSNPLTARVAVNRVWMRYFGVGLVNNPDDFGLRCDAPIHRELLDWLSASLIENQWSMKWLHRTIMESAAYQRSSIEPASFKASEVDPENTLLWRQNRRRLDFEATRDTMLAVSGELDRKLDGPSVKLSQLPYSFRRTVYAYVDRVDMDPILKTFDFASPLASAATRSETTVPQHALFVMNHPFVIERAKTIAAKVRPADATKESMVRGVNSLFRRMLSRTPSAQERANAISFLSAPISTDGLRRLSPWTYGVLDRRESETGVFVELPHWTGESYQGSPDYPDAKFFHARLTSLGGHPGNPKTDCVRRFTVPATGVAKITGMLKHLRDRGDGVIATLNIRKSPSEHPAEVGRWDAFNSEVATHVKEISVAAGATLDFVVAAGQTSSSDAYNWTADIEIEFDGESSTQWSSKDGFKPPAPALMDTWEQLAQALMLTNEFIYID